MKWKFAGVVFNCHSVGGADSVHEKFSLDSMPQRAVVWFLFPHSRLAFLPYAVFCCFVFKAKIIGYV